MDDSRILSSRQAVLVMLLKGEGEYGKLYPLDEELGVRLLNPDDGLWVLFRRGEEDHPIDVLQPSAMGSLSELSSRIDSVTNTVDATDPDPEAERWIA